MEYLVVMEVSRKQDYIFKTNRMSEDIGASILIRYVTEELPAEIAKKYKLDYDPVLSGGGKSVYAFRSNEDALQFTEKVSSRVLIDYAGIELFFASNFYDETKNSIICAINDLYEKLEETKSGREASFRIYDLGITKQCESTGLPAADIWRVGNTKRYVSLEAKSKLEQARKQQDEIFSELLPKGKFRFARELVELGSSMYDKSSIAIVVVDSNKMGRKLEKFRNDFEKNNAPKDGDFSEFNSEYKKMSWKLGNDIDKKFKGAMKDALGKLAANMDTLKKTLSITIDSDGTTVLPFRPLIQAGDDICFVTDARIGVAMQEEVIKNIEKISIPQLPDTKFHACSGAAIIPLKYPFFRGHKLAEDLCQSAKTVLGDEGDEPVLDFHIVQGETQESIADIRKEYYNEGRLTSKPFYLNRKDEDKAGTLACFKKHMKVWKQCKKDKDEPIVGRGAIKEFREALMGGKETTDQYVSDRRLKERFSKENIDFPESYDERGHCIDFDVIEAMDLCEIEILDEAE